MRFFRKNVIAQSLHHSGVTYAPSSNLNYFWNFGVIALFCLFVQIFTGIFLAMHYVANIEFAFFSVERIMRDVSYGWLLRYVHENGASMFFIAVYIHFFRGLYYGSYLPPRSLLWCSGVLILLIMIATAFMGYVLPWGQMSFWAATVITNLFSAIPVVGYNFVYWLWGGQAIGNATLNRFFSLHYLLPFLLVALVFIHLVFLHNAKSNNPLGVQCKNINISFSPYFVIKDVFGLIIFIFPFVFFVFFYPNYLGHPDNYIMANPFVTPSHIVPEWYFLPFYAILRAIPSKEGGALLLLASIIILFLLPFIVSSLTNIQFRSGSFRPFYKISFYVFMADCYFLYKIGGAPVVYPYFEIGQWATVVYFLFFVVLVPISVLIEKNFYYYFIGNSYRFNTFFTRETR